jgi:hypothetical protein
MTYNDISSTDSTFNDFTSFANYNSTMNFFVGTDAEENGGALDLNDNEYIRIRAYSHNETN